MKYHNILYILTTYASLLCMASHAAQPNMQPLVEFLTNVGTNPLPVFIAISEPNDTETKSMVLKLEPMFAGIIDIIQLDTQEHASIALPMAPSTPSFYFFKQGVPVIQSMHAPLSEEKLIAILTIFKEEYDRLEEENKVALEAFQKTILQSTQPTLLYFTATWCPPCQKIKPLVKEVFDQHENHIQCAMLDFDQNRKVAELLGVVAVPTFVFMKDGQELYRFTGATSVAAFNTLITTLFGDPASKEGLDTIVSQGMQEIRSLFEIVHEEPKEDDDEEKD